MARARRSSSSRPRARAASGTRSPTRVIGRRRGVVTPAPAQDRAGRPSGSARTSQVRAIARSAGSRSSSVVVVTNAWGSSAMRRTRCERRSGSSSLKTSSRSSRGGRPSSSVSRSSSASLKARMAVRCWPREAKPARSRPDRSKARSSRCGPTTRRAVPDLLLGGLDEASGERVAGRLAGQGRGVGHVAQGQPAGGRLVGGDLGMGRRERPGDLLEQAQPRVDDPSAGVEQGPVPEAQLVAGGAFLADGPEQAVALLERPPVRRQVVGVGREAGGREQVEGRPTERRRADDQEHLLGREEHDPERPAEGAGAAADAVDPDPLAAAAAVGPRALDGDLQDLVVDVALDAGQVGAPADELAVGRGPVGSSPAQQGDGLEEAGLAGRVGPDDEVGSRLEVGLAGSRSRAGRGR